MADPWGPRSGSGPGTWVGLESNRPATAEGARPRGSAIEKGESLAELPLRASRSRTRSGVREDLLHLQGKAHVALDLQLAAHEGHLGVELAVDHVEVVARRHRDGDVGRARRAPP